MTATNTPTPQILIIGGGITGLLFAQSLRKRHLSSTNTIPESSTPTPSFRIFERDPTPGFRGAGWGLTIHWGLSDFVSLLPRYLVDRLPETYVDRAAVERGEKGSFLLFDLQNGEEKWRVPPSERIRVSREKLRALLMDGLDIEWSKTLVGISTSDEKDRKITATFSDGSTATGNLLIGADGSRSQVRRIICPLKYQNKALPVRLLGVSVPYSKRRCEEIRALDPFFFQATDPQSDAFFWFSFLKVPQPSHLETRDNGTAATIEEQAECQILISWPFRNGFHGRPEPVDTPEGNEKRVRWMKELASNWIEPFRSIVHDIPEDAEAKTLALEDWVPELGSWDNRDGRVTLVGDAAHAMTMYRGEAANHGIADIASLYRHLFPDNTTTESSDLEADQETNKETAQQTAIQKYEEEMIPRAKIAVLTSRRACLDAHESARITESSPLVARRVMILEE